MKNFNGDVRDIFFENIKKNFLKNKKNFILTNDADVFALKKVRKNKRFIDSGVAEQNLINISAGLAKYNNLPLIYGFCSFLTFRCYEQLRFNVASHNLNVKIIGIGPGFSFPYDGPTHHGIQDVYLMYLIPEFEIYNISDNNLADKISKNINFIKGPTYIRLDKGNLNYNNNIKYNLKKGFEIIYNSTKRHTLIITTGVFCRNTLELASKSKKISVMNLFKLKNFDKKKFIHELKKYKQIIVYDESAKSGGIFPIINNLISLSKVNIKLNHLTASDKQLFIYNLSRDEIIKRQFIDIESLKKKFNL